MSSHISSFFHMCMYFLKEYLYQFCGSFIHAYNILVPIHPPPACPTTADTLFQYEPPHFHTFSIYCIPHWASLLLYIFVLVMKSSFMGLD